MRISVGFVCGWTVAGRPWSSTHLICVLQVPHNLWLELLHIQTNRKLVHLVLFPRMGKELATPGKTFELCSFWYIWCAYTFTGPFTCTRFHIYSRIVSMAGAGMEWFHVKWTSSLLMAWPCWALATPWTSATLKRNLGRYMTMLNVVGLSFIQGFFAVHLSSYICKMMLFYEYQFKDHQIVKSCVALHCIWCNQLNQVAWHNVCMLQMRPTSSLLGPQNVASALGMWIINLVFVLSALSFMTAQPGYVKWPAK